MAWLAHGTKAFRDWGAHVVRFTCACPVTRHCSPQRLVRAGANVKGFEHGRSLQTPQEEEEDQSGASTGEEGQEERAERAKSDGQTYARRAEEPDEATCGRQ